MEGLVACLLFEYTGFACRLAANLRKETNEFGDVISGDEPAYHNQLGHVQLPTCKGRIMRVSVNVGQKVDNDAM